VKKNTTIRNIAIIAHVDHGKTTLVDGMLRQSGTFRDNQMIRERVMDSNDLERERGITIVSKNTSIHVGDHKINIVDTPGHADFGGEVERVLKMVDGVLLLVDAFEGTMPQTRFVLRKALALHLTPIVVVNKIDRPEARPKEVLDEVLELFMDLGVSDWQLDFPVVYASAREGYAVLHTQDEKVDLKPLFQTILDHIPAPNGDSEGSLQILVSSIDYDDYVGRIAIGRIERGAVKTGDGVLVALKDGNFKNGKITKIYEYMGLKKAEVQKAYAGDIVAVAGIPDIHVGETICATDNPQPLPFVDIEEPTISMEFLVNDSPFAGREGTFVTSRQLRERLFKELQSNISLRVEETETTDAFKVSGRGELHLSILIETMRREGYEFQVSKPKVIQKCMNGVPHEPMEYLVIDIPEEYTGVVMEKLGSRKAEMVNMMPSVTGYTKMEFRIPARGLIGYRSEFLTDTKGNGMMNHIFDGYEPFKGDIAGRTRGVMTAWENGEAVTYGLYNAQERGALFIEPGTPVYEGMIVGENARKEEMVINVCKKKHVTNIRASGSDDALRLVPSRKFSLEQSLEFIEDDELVEVTPKSIRLRKKILNQDARSKGRNQ
jgi:GTP-binding protein